MREDLIPDRVAAEYVCGISSCGAASTWKKSFPDSAFERVEEMEGFFREQILRGVERRCGSCKKPLKTRDLKRATYSCWCARAGQELVLELTPHPGRLRRTYPIRRFFLHRDGDREALQSAHDPRLRSVMVESILRAGALLAEEPGRSDEGVRLIRQAVEMEPDHGMGHARLGEALYRDGLVEEAEEALRAAILRDVTCEVALELLARICHSSERWAEAETYFQRARMVSVDRPEHFLGEARAQVRLGRSAEAYQTSRELLRLDSGSRPGLRIAAILAEDLEEDKARPLLERLEEGARKEGDGSLGDLARERLLLLSLPRFRPKIGEEPEDSLKRLEETLASLGFSVERGEVRGKVMPGLKTSLGRRSVYMNAFPGRFDDREREGLFDWLEGIRAVSKKAYVQVCTALPCPYSVRKIASTLPEAILDLRSERLSTPEDPRAGALALVEAAGPLGGLPEDPTPEALQIVDAMLLGKYHDDGFGEIRPATALLFAHYAGEAIRAGVGGEWREDHPVSILQTPRGGVDLLAKVRALVTNGSEDSLAYLYRVTHN